MGRLIFLLFKKEMDQLTQLDETQNSHTMPYPQFIKNNINELRNNLH